jgi:hypothetical protein
MAHRYHVDLILRSTAWSSTLSLETVQVRQLMYVWIRRGDVTAGGIAGRGGRA